MLKYFRIKLTSLQYGWSVLTVALIGSTALTPAHAATKTWTPVSGNNWFTAGNWSAAGVPVSGDDVTVNNVNQAVIDSIAATANTATIGTTTTGGTLTIRNGGSASIAGVTGIASSPTSQGTLTVTGNGSSLRSGGTLHIGLGGAGALSVTNGANAAATVNSTIGNSATGNGVLTVSGAGSMFSAVNVFIGNSGTGSLMVSDGAHVNLTAVGTVGTNAGSHGTATITGTSTVWSMANLDVGSSGTGTLIVSNGGQVIASGSQALIGTLVGASGSATVSGAGSLLRVNELRIGNRANAELTALDGAHVTGANLYIGYISGSQGEIKLSDSGTRLELTADAYLGGGAPRLDAICTCGAGTLTVSNGANFSVSAGKVYGEAGKTTDIVSTATVYIARAAGASGTLNIGAAAGDAAVAPGTVEASSVAFGSGTGTINFNHTSSAYVFTPAISGNGAINALSGNTLLAGDMSAFTGTITTSSGANITTGAAQITSAQGLADHQTAAMVEGRAVGNTLLGFTRPVDHSSYLYTGGMFGSAEAIASGQYSTDESPVTVIGGISYGQDDSPGIDESDALTVAMAFRYTFGDKNQTVRPYAELGGWITPDQHLNMSRQYSINALGNSGDKIIANGSTDATASAQFFRGGMIWEINSTDQVVGFGEIGRQSLSYSSYTEQGGPFPALIEGGSNHFYVARIGGAWTHDLGGVIDLPVSITAAGALARSLATEAETQAVVNGVRFSGEGEDQTWSEFGLSLGYDLSERLNLSVGINGTAGPDIDTALHGNIGLSYRF